MYTGAAHSFSKQDGPDVSHRELLHHFTGHLSPEEYEYFTKWDRLIDLEADASGSLISKAWLMEAKDRENKLSNCVSSLVFAPEASSPQAVFDESWFADIAFRRSELSNTQTPLSNVGFQPGTRVVISMDATSVAVTHTSGTNGPRRYGRPHMHIVRGVVRNASESQLHILASRDDLNRIENAVKSSPNEHTTFRMDIEDFPTGITTLRQNLVNLFTGDKKPPDAPGSQVELSRLSWLRSVLIRLHKPNFNRTLVKHMFTPGQDAPTQPIAGCDLLDLCFEFSSLNPDQREAVEQVRRPSRCVSTIRATLTPLSTTGCLCQRLHIDSRIARDGENFHHCFCGTAARSTWKARPDYLVHSRRSRQRPSKVS